MSGPFHSFCVLLAKLQIFEYSNYLNSFMVEYSNGKIGIRPRPTVHVRGE